LGMQQPPGMHFLGNICSCVAASPAGRSEVNKTAS
jgi:hypothetical protein